MTLKVNLAEFMFSKKAGELQRQLEAETECKWDIRYTCHNLRDDHMMFCCSHCMATVFVVDDYGEPQIWLNSVAQDMSYCPNCGARILN